MKTVFFDAKHNKTLVKETQFNLGDVVKIFDAGGVYSYYGSAFHKMHGEIFDFSNLKISGDHWSKRIYLGGISDKKIKNLKWIIVGKTLHEDEMSGVICLLMNPSTSYGLMVSENALKLLIPNPYHVNESKFVFQKTTR